MRAVCASVMLLVGSLAAPARAQSEGAPESPETLVAEGERLAREGRVAESLPLFREAARREASGKHECLVALTYFRLDRHPEAWLHLERARALGQRPTWCGDSVLVRDVERALDGGGFTLVDIRVGVNGARLSVSAFASEAPLPAPARIWLPWGTQRVRVEREGYESREVDVVVEGKDPIPVVVELEPVAAAGASGKSATRSTADGARERDLEGVRARSRWPWGLVVLGAASLAGGAGFHLAAARSRDGASEMYDGPGYEAELDRFRLRRGAAIGLYAAGTVLTVAGVALLVRRRGERGAGDVALSLVPTEGGAAVWLRVDR